MNSINIVNRLQRGATSISDGIFIMHLNQIYLKFGGNWVLGELQFFIPSTYAVSRQGLAVEGWSLKIETTKRSRVSAAARVGGGQKRKCWRNWFVTMYSTVSRDTPTKTTKYFGQNHFCRKHIKRKTGSGFLI